MYYDYVRGVLTIAAHVLSSFRRVLSCTPTIGQLAAWNELKSCILCVYHWYLEQSILKVTLGERSLGPEAFCCLNASYFTVTGVGTYSLTITLA